MNYFFFNTNCNFINDWTLKNSKVYIRFPIFKHQRAQENFLKVPPYITHMFYYLDFALVFPSMMSGATYQELIMYQTFFVI